jgi:hypothetical protein
VIVGVAVRVGVGERVTEEIGLGVIVGNEVGINARSVLVAVNGDVVCPGPQPVSSRTRTKQGMLHFMVIPLHF